MYNYLARVMKNLRYVLLTALAMVTTIVVAFVTGRITGFITYLFGTKEIPFDDSEDFILEEE